MGGEMGIQRDFALSKGHRAHIRKAWAAAPDVGPSLCLSAGLGPSPLTFTRAPISSSLGQRMGLFHPGSHADGGSEPSPGLGQDSRSGVYKSQMPGCECPLPLAWCALPVLVPGVWAPPA